MWNFRINGGHICLKETMQYRFIGLGFEYYVLSQATYNSPRQDFQLPSISTVTIMTSKVKTDVQSFFVH